MASEENAAHLLDTLLRRQLRQRRGGRPLAGVDPGHGAQPVGAAPVARSPAPAPQPRRISRPSEPRNPPPPAKTTTGNHTARADPAAQTPTRRPRAVRQSPLPAISRGRADQRKNKSSTLTRTGLFITSSTKRLETIRAGVVRVVFFFWAFFFGGAVLPSGTLFCVMGWSRIMADGVSGVLYRRGFEARARRLVRSLSSGSSRWCAPYNPQLRLIWPCDTASFGAWSHCRWDPPPMYSRHLRGHF